MDYNAKFPVDTATGFVVSEAAPPGADSSIPDYIPSNFKVRRDAVNPRKQANQIDNNMSVRVINEGVEYRTQEEQAIITAEREKKVDIVARRILETHRQAMKLYRSAKKYLEMQSPEEMENPSEKTQRALSIVRKGPPITKSQAREQAIEHIIRMT